VPAGIDRFPRELMERYFGGWAAECGISIDDAHGARAPPDEPPTSRSTWP
jgi:starch phosphorylase